MLPTRQLIDDVFRDKVEAARRMRPEDKLFAGEELFEYACEITRAGIRRQHPEADEARVAELLRARLALRARLERRPAT